uniref:uncharacterized protein LOC122608394 n=1 Tax=Erigeron canadensis TaxID=72917 RepID=UPI001CB91B04|nr:uncharacterized protein LOC122608394 [Erigeron canadensis]
MEHKNGSKSSSDEKQPLTLGYTCSDDLKVKLDMKCFYEAKFIYGRLDEIDMRLNEEEDEGEEDPYRKPRDISFIGQVTSPSYVAVLVNIYCVGRFNIMRTHQHDDDVDLLARKLMEFDSQFIQDLVERPNLLVLLFNAAVQLRIESLINLVLNTIHGRGLIDAIFNMPAIKDSEFPFYNRYFWDVAAVAKIEDDSC